MVEFFEVEDVYPPEISVHPENRTPDEDSQLNVDELRLIITALTMHADVYRGLQVPEGAAAADSLAAKVNRMLLSGRDVVIVPF